MNTEPIADGASPGPRVARTIRDVRRAVAEARADGKTIGLVPTMGALHEGHRQLIVEASRSADLVVVSIFVNPTQFGPTEDFSRYPRTLESDLATCGRGGAALVFVPDVSEVYPDDRAATFVEVPGISDVLEGASRPGHFRGVATVVLKLFNMVGPDLAFFGAKDFQQQAVIRRMARDLDLPVDIRVVPTVRDADGLALSSRNRYLSAEERQSGLVLSRALREARGSVDAGETDAGRVRQILRDAIESERGATLDYAEVVDVETLTPIRAIEAGRGAVALVAARVGPARLIDNALLSP